jgi:hypothetical protein
MPKQITLGMLDELRAQLDDARDILKGKFPPELWVAVERLIAAETMHEAQRVTLYLDAAQQFLGSWKEAINGIIAKRHQDPVSSWGNKK